MSPMGRSPVIRRGPTAREFLVFDAHPPARRWLFAGAQIADQIDVTPAIGLILRLARTLLTAFAVTNVDMLDA